MYFSLKNSFRATAFVFMMAAASLAQNNTGEIQDLKQDIKELKEEVAALREELKGMRGDIMKAISSMKSAAAPCGPPATTRDVPGWEEGSEFEVTTIDGEKVTIGGKREKPQVLFCYASWCGFCKKSLPWIETLHEKYKEKGVDVLALNLDARGEGGRARSLEQTMNHYRDLKLSMPMTTTTGSNDTAKIGAQYKAQSFPTLFVLGQSGEVESVHIGAKPGLADTVGKELDILLQGKNRTAFPK